MTASNFFSSAGAAGLAKGSSRTIDEVIEGGGTKAMQLVKTPEGWKIAALAWFDET